MDITHVTLGDRIIPLSICRHARARSISLRLSAGKDMIVMTLPRRAAVHDGMQFFLSKQNWVLANVETAGSIAFEGGAELPVLGKTIILRHLPGRRTAQLVGGELHVYGAREFITRRVRDFLKKILREECAKRAAEKADMLGKTVRSVKIRDARSRWGSCSRSGNLIFNWRLVFAPVDVLDYLIAHEVAHLAHMNHSERFWETVSRLHPNPAHARNWLKREGHKLHRYG